MTDEEMAEERKADYGIDLCCYCRECDVETLYPCQHKIDAMHGYKDGFLAGLKAGRPQWHDINDTGPSKEQLGKQLLIRMKSVIGDTDYDYLVYKYSGESITDVPDVIAWCEIPEFK